MTDSIQEALAGINLKRWIDPVRCSVTNYKSQILIATGVVLAIVILAVLICIWVHKSKRIAIDYSCPEGTFKVKGKAERFVIKKGRRFCFVVENGEIVAFKDRQISRNAIPYTLRGDRSNGQTS